MKVFYEDLNDVPEDQHSEFVESEWDGKKGYQHESVAKLAHAFSSTKEKLNETRTELDGFKTRLDSIDEEKRKAAEEAEQRAYERAKKEGNTEELEKRHEQQREHAKKTGYEEGYEAAKKEFSEQRAKEKAQSIASKVAGKYAADEYAAELLEEWIARQIDYDTESDKQVFLDEQGNATTWDLDSFERQVAENPKFKRLLKSDVVTNGGGKTQGSNNSNAVTKPIKDMTDAERLEFKQRDPDGFLRASRQR